MPTERIRLVVLFGGRSAEHEVSCTTARHVIAALDAERYEIEPIGITREGVWVRDDEAIAALRRGIGELPEQLSATGTEIAPLQAVKATNEVSTVDTAVTVSTVESAQAAPDTVTVVLPLLHGPHGEDGTVQGMLELAGVPYVGAGVLGSALAMDKVAAKQMADANQIPQARWHPVRQGTADSKTIERIAADLGMPCFVKPANMGSSVGVSRVNDRSELADALDLAFGYDEFALVEEAVTGDEIEVGVLGNEHPRASVPGQVIPANEFYDYADKYIDGKTEYRIPAPLNDLETDEVRSLAVRAFVALRAEGMARCDFFHEPDGRGFLLNEINTIPGFTPYSMYPKLWEASGLPYAKLLDELVALAVQRHRRRSGFRTDH